MSTQAQRASIGPAGLLAPEVFQRRRERVLTRAGDGVVVLLAAPQLHKSRDTEVEYRPDSDLFYLTGADEPETVAVLTPHDPDRRFTLFVRRRDPEREAWHGPRVGVERAGERFGADAVYPIDELDDHLWDLLRPASRIHYPLGSHPVMDQKVMAALVRARTARQRAGAGPTALHDLDALLGPLRQVKEPEEIERLRVAGRIGAAGHVAAMRHARPGVGEWELEAVLEATFRSLGATGPAFPSIVGSGANATVLHYVTNSARAGDGDLVLIDAGAEWGMYCSDITRTFPVSGRFSSPQRDLYEVVLAAEEAAIAAARPGGTIADVHDAAVRELTRGMVHLGLLRGEVDRLIADGEFRRFYLHQTSHWLGLDVHDTGLYREGEALVPLAPGMVFTVEPGLYVPADADVPGHFRGVGIRIEDDVLITDAGCELLTRDVPVAPDEVEALVGRG